MWMWKEKEEKKAKYSESGCACLYFFLLMLFYDKIAKNKEEFNILICSRLRIMNLHVSRISNIQWKDKFLKLL